MLPEDLDLVQSDEGVQVLGRVSDRVENVDSSEREHDGVDRQADDDLLLQGSPP